MDSGLFKWSESRMSIFNVLNHKPNGGWKETIVESGSLSADAHRPAVPQVLVRVHPLEQSMGWLVSVQNSALGFFSYCALWRWCPLKEGQSQWPSPQFWWPSAASFSQAQLCSRTTLWFHGSGCFQPALCGLVRGVGILAQPSSAAWWSATSAELFSLLLLWYFFLARLSVMWRQRNLWLSVSST